MYFNLTILLNIISIFKAVLEKDKEKALKESVTLKTSVTTLTAKVETLNKNIALQKETEKELQVCKAVNIYCRLTLSATYSIYQMD